MRVNSLAAIAAVAIGLCCTAMAQDATPPLAPHQDQPGIYSGNVTGTAVHGVGGKITAIDGSMVTLQTFSRGAAKVTILSSTRLMKDRIEAKLSDFKVGDWVFAAGEQGKDGVWTAQMLRQRPEGRGLTRGGGGMGGITGLPEDNGKTYILGEVTKLEGTKLTVRKPDNTEQIIEVDDDTSFRNERRESVTLADMKAGDFVRGKGTVKDGVFVPRELNAGRPRRPRPGIPSATQDGALNQVAPETSSEKK